MTEKHGNNMGARFWVPILIMTLISVVSISTNVYLGSLRAAQQRHIVRLITNMERQVEWNVQQDKDILLIRERSKRVEEKLDQALAILLEHRGETQN